MTAFDGLPDTLSPWAQDRVNNLTERREHSDTMRFTASDAIELEIWEDMIKAIEGRGPPK